MEKFMLPCFSKMITGVDCPGCGFQRAVFMVFQGDFASAFKMYPAVYSLLLFFLVALLHFVDKSRNYTSLLKYLGILNGIIILVAYFLKFTF